ITNTGGVPAYQFPMTEYVSKEQSYFYRSSLALQKHTFNAFSTYRLSLQDRHDLKIMLGSNIVAEDWDSHWSERTELINPDNPQFPFTVGTPDVGGSADWESQFGVFGRINYAFMDKYLLE